MVSWMTVASIPLLAFSASLHVLYLDPFPGRVRDPVADTDCIDPDHSFEAFGTALYTLLEVAPHTDSSCGLRPYHSPCVLCRDTPLVRGLPFLPSALRSR